MVTARLLVVVAALVTPASARAALATGTLFTNFVSATFGLPSGLPGVETTPGNGPYNIPYSATSWYVTTELPFQCLRHAKSVEPPSVPPGAPAWFTISYSNCGALTAHAVTLTDRMPCGMLRSGEQVEVWGQNGVVSASWATSLAGPWNTTSPAGLGCPLYLRWVLPNVSAHRTGFVRFCVTVQ